MEFWVKWNSCILSFCLHNRSPSLLIIWHYSQINTVCCSMNILNRISKSIFIHDLLLQMIFSVLLLLLAHFKSIVLYLPTNLISWPTFDSNQPTWIDIISNSYVYFNVNKISLSALPTTTNILQFRAFWLQHTEVFSLLLKWLRILARQIRDDLNYNNQIDRIRF